MQLGYRNCNNFYASVSTLPLSSRAKKLSRLSVKRDGSPSPAINKTRQPWCALILAF